MDQKGEEKTVQLSEAVKSVEGISNTKGSPLPVKDEPISHPPQGSRHSPEAKATSVEEEPQLKSEPVSDVSPNAKPSGEVGESSGQSVDKDNNNRETSIVLPFSGYVPKPTCNGDSEEDDDEFGDDDELENPVSRPKRSRTAYTAFQLDQLEWVFSQTHYPDVLIRQELSTRLGIAEAKLQIWFQNRRARWRKQQRTGCVSSRSRSRKRQGAAGSVSSFPMGMTLPPVSPWVLQPPNVQGSNNATAVCGGSNPPGFFYSVTNAAAETVTNGPLPISSAPMPTALPSISSLSGPVNPSPLYSPQGIVPARPLPLPPGQLPPSYPQLLPIPVMTLSSQQAMNESPPLYNAPYQTVEH